MQKYFYNIGILGNPENNNTFKIYNLINIWLKNKGYKIFVENRIAKKLKLFSENIKNIKEIGKYCDLAIIVGGDGNILGISRNLYLYDIKIVGINLGHLGFLADINTKEIKKKLKLILSGNYIIEKKFLLEVYKYNNLKKIGTALNEIILHSKNIIKIIEFKVYIDEKFAFYQRSDGLIISTPTGSTAYSLSMGGPIIMTSLNVIEIISIFPHTLSSRPLIISNKNRIRIKFNKNYKNLQIIFDNQIIVPINSNKDILIECRNNFLNFIHPNSYDYFKILISKLGWTKKLF
ncbi:NAD(+)/NADH kinase [Candidatus Annandia pinicola]|uniref:NAD(+)/NADH kinase n=1 Tax=Candidatus Annandia pinicola TaxID=1345117 RepID=UPI001D01CBF1|nr:NAD(+)/NADH kinase [Candidatus Annandia pinicola]UDG80318.1 NAD kinase [Candidatus Annandia pinicola]